jgi:preprotein translocase subunit SecD
VRAIILILALTGSAATGAPPRFTIAGEAFAQVEIADARALPRIGAAPTVLITLEGGGVSRLEAISRAHVGKTLTVALDGNPVCAPVVPAPIADGAIEMPCSFATMEAAAAFARTISGKEPLPDSLED